MPEKDSQLPDGAQTAKDLDALYRSGNAIEVLRAPTLDDLRSRPFYLEANKAILVESYRGIYPAGSIAQEAQRLLLVAGDVIKDRSLELMFVTEEQCVEIAARLREMSPVTLADAARQTYEEELARNERSGEGGNLVQDWSVMVDITQEAVRQWEINPATFAPAI